LVSRLGKAVSRAGWGGGNDPQVDPWGGGVTGQGHKAHPSSLGFSISCSTCHSQLSGKRLREVMSSSARKSSSAWPEGGSTPLDRGLRGPAPGWTPYHPSIIQALLLFCPSVVQVSPNFHPSIAQNSSQHCPRTAEAIPEVHPTFTQASPKHHAKIAKATPAVHLTFTSAPTQALPSHHPSIALATPEAHLTFT